ncbi:MAG: peptidoglycan-binding protein [Candidatus Omnitrophica bacterium]|nr:peptidoglycan-binding protein [Candidatus Omnitrophota bacterium]
MIRGHRGGVVMLAAVLAVAGCAASRAARTQGSSSAPASPAYGSSSGAWTPPETVSFKELFPEPVPPKPSTAVTSHKTTPAAVTKPTTRQIQRALKRAGLYAGTVDGKPGPKTTAAVIKFQKSRGLKPDGVVGRKTWQQLKSYLPAE